MAVYFNINQHQNLPDSEQVIACLKAVKAQLQHQHQRILLNCQGDDGWRRCIVDYEVAQCNALIVSNATDWPRAIPFAKAAGLLGSEADSVVVDASDGLNVDVLCMVAGLVKAGGYLLLLTPPDPLSHADRYGCWQGQAAQSRYFLRYFYRQVEQQQWVLRQREESSCNACQRLEKAQTEVLDGALSEAQAQLFEKLQAWLKHQQAAIFILTAERGRGKSTLLGYFASRYSQRLSIVVSAASRQQAQVLLHLLENFDGTVEFIAPDEIIRRHERIECLIIDEAAMLPGSVLQQCLGLADKVLLATTTGGYEGTGQGFLLKWLARLLPQAYIHESLQPPVRWGRKDALEQWMNTVLLLPRMSQQLSGEDANRLVEPGCASSSRSDGAPSTPAGCFEIDLLDGCERGKAASCQLEWIDKAMLWQNHPLLRSVYGLLVSAHYRTRPSDLRQIMEDDTQQLLVARINECIVGVLLMNREGGFEPALARQIFLGRRRPQGHLLAQMMTAQAGLENFACHRGLRIQRIAVQQQWRRQGLGRRMIEQAIIRARQQQMEYIGSSFAIDATVLPFWRSLGFELLHIGSGKGVASAAQTVAVMHALTPAVDRLLALQRAKIKKYLAQWMMGYCQSMIWQEVLELLKIVDIDYLFSTQDQAEIMAFSEGFRGLDYCQPLLQEYLINRLHRVLLDDQDYSLAIEKILQNKDWKQLTFSQGRKHSIKKLRRIIGKLRMANETTK